MLKPINSSPPKRWYFYFLIILIDAILCVRVVESSIGPYFVVVIAYNENMVVALRVLTYDQFTQVYGFTIESDVVLRCLIYDIRHEIM